ncbi:hypothetical protein [Mucilaginibacter sp.]
MQDKELDSLFNSKLDDFEMEPSPKVWNGIADELHGKKGKRVVIYYLSVAASVIILVSAGLLFFNHTQNTFVKPVKQNKVAVKIDKLLPVGDRVKSGTLTTQRMVDAPVNSVTNVSKQAVNMPEEGVNKTATEIPVPINSPGITGPLPTNKPLLAVVTEPQQKQPAMVVPSKATSFTTTPADDQQVPEVVITTTETINTPVKKRGIHSVGGLINAIIAKVDKREDKLIEFTEDDEDGSAITGLNLGLIKIKKQ